MPRLHPSQVPGLKLDPAGDALEETLTPEQARRLFEAPGATVIAVVELTSVSYTGHASTTRQPQVKLAVRTAVPAVTARQEEQLREIARALHRGHTLAGTLDEFGVAQEDLSTAVQQVLDAHPDEDTYAAHQRAANARDRTEYVR